MIFSSFPVYLDHPNLHQFQQQDHNNQQENGVENPQLPNPTPPGQSLQSGGGDAGAGSIRPGSLVDRARQAKIPLPEAGLKCPRCDSTNTKFCYFNNYNLSQPRHFCKTCRRYWTRGGALRSVPVGGGCRRNKRTKSGSSSKSTASNDKQIAGGTTNSTSSATPSSYTTHMAAQFSQSSTQLPLMAALQNFNPYGGSNIGGFHSQMMPSGGNGITDMGFNIGSNISDGTGDHEQWKYPSMVGFEPSTNLFSFQNEGVEIASSMIGDHRLPSITPSSSGVSQMASVKMEIRNQELNLSRQFLGDHSENNQQWAAPTSWSGFSGLNSSSTNHLL